MRKLLFFTLLTLALAFLPVMLLRGNLWLSSDFLHQEVAFILETKRMLATGAPWWSWNTYLGSDFIGSYAFYTLTSPFVWINCLFPESLLEVGLCITLILKFLCLAFLSSVYLRKMGVSSENSALGSFLFTFSSFNIASLYYYHFYEPIIAFILLLLALERLLRNENWGMTCVALAAFIVTFVNFYFAISSFIAALIYVIFRQFDSDVRINVFVFTKGVVAVVVGIMMCSFLLLPVCSQMLETTRTEAHSALDATALYNIFERLRTVIMPKVVEGTTAFVPEGSASLSNEACISVFGASLAIIYACRCRDWLSALLATFMILYLTPLNGIFTLFTNPLYTRWAYALTLIIVLCTVKVLDEKCNVKRGVVLYSITASILVLMFTANALIAGGLHVLGARFMALIALFFGGIIVLVLWSIGKISFRWLKGAMVGCVVVQMWLFLLNLASINSGLDSERYKSYIQDVECGSSSNVGYRVDFRGQENDFISYNLGLLRNHASVEGYHSVITSGIDSLYKTATRDFWATNKLRANIYQDDFDALLSVRYVYDIDSLGNVAMRDAKRYIPIGFSYNSYITRSEFNKMFDDTTRNLPRLMLSHLVIEDNDEPIFKSIMQHGIESNDSSIVVATSFSGNSCGYKALVNVAKPSVLYFSVPFAKGFSAKIDGKPLTIYKANLCMQAMIVPQGRHSIVAEYFPPGLKTGAFISAGSVLLLVLIALNDKLKKRRSR